MTSRDAYPDDGPELVPPAELLRLRAELARPPRPELRAQHLAATAMAARQRGNHPMGRFASRSARAAVAIVAALAVTSGLAGAQLLPDQAQRLLSNVSNRFAPTEDRDPPAEPATPGDASTTVRSATDDPPRDDDEPADAPASTTVATDDEPTVGPGTTSATTTLPAVTTTTIPGPAGPGSPDDPTDPDPTTTTTVPPTTTTTQPPTTTTTQPPTTTTTGGGTP